ncbi:hypothetical protein EMCRGX_G009105 [Ephydatia muelleri]
MLASQKGQVECVKILLDRGAEINVQEEDGWTALMVASWEGQVECVKMLLDRGAEVNMPKKDKQFIGLSVEAQSSINSSIDATSSIAKAAGIPEATLRRSKCKPETMDHCASPPTLLSDEEELGLATAALWLKERGLPLDVFQLKHCAKEIAEARGNGGVPRAIISAVKHFDGNARVCVTPNGDSSFVRQNYGTEQKLRKGQLREAKWAKKVQEKEAKKQCSAEFRSGKRKGQQCTVMCPPDTEGHFLCKRHNVPRLDVVPFDVHLSASLNEHTDSDTSQGQDEADSLLEE